MEGQGCKADPGLCEDPIAGFVECPPPPPPALNCSVEPVYLTESEKKDCLRECKDKNTWETAGCALLARWGSYGWIAGIGCKVLADFAEPECVETRCENPVKIECK